MKKIVIILLTVLPIFLIVVISFAGRIFSEVTHIPVESVAFVDETENKYPDNKEFKLNKGDTLQLNVKVYPELASNQKVNFSSSDEDICTVDNNGLVTAVGNKLATAIITVKTDEKSVTDRIYITVYNEHVEEVKITDSNDNDVEEIQMSVGEITKLFATITPLTAVNKKVTWISDNPSVAYVDQLGQITAKKPGTAVITVTTNDGQKIDKCTIIVDDSTAKLGFDFSSATNIYAIGAGYFSTVREIKITDYLVYDKNSIDFSNIIITADNGTYDNESGILKFENGDGPTSYVIVRASVNDGSGIMTEVKIFLKE